MARNQVEIRIKAPKGWGKTQLAGEIAVEISRMKGGRVLIVDDGHGVYAGYGRRTVARITIEQAT